ncbi:MAG: family 10 glycosylhydrolase [Synechococcales cyanobacterium T60_A2020_003]|nr:family 10 glycosylhydrolase [Synechococcales cyanobacterium T60_A2020_003]
MDHSPVVTTVLKLRRLSPLVFASLTLLSLLLSLGLTTPTQAQTAPYCQMPDADVTAKETLRQAALSGDEGAIASYQAILQDHANQLKDCRSQSSIHEQAMWIRLYPCDALPGVLDALLDHIVNKGYNAVYVEAFYNGQVLLPQAENQTPWPSVIRTPGYEQKDLLAEAIAKGHQRGLKVNAWMFTMNFGYTYSQRSDRQDALARNGRGLTSVEMASIASGGTANSEETFIDPYSDIAKQDYYYMAEAIAQRNPDGMLFDYVRYPKGAGADSVASKVSDLWIYGSASQQALENRAQNQRGRELISRFLDQGYISANDIESVKSLYPQESEPLWEGRSPSSSATPRSASDLQPVLQRELWYLSIAHAFQGVIDFVNLATLAPQRHGITELGTVFFPEGNDVIGQGFDSRMQPWDRFPSNLERHPMVYAVCGEADCIMAQIREVVDASPGITVKPVLAGIWGKELDGHPSLEIQMQALRQTFPQIDSVSHFAYSWQEPDIDNQRKFCQLR